MSHITGAHDEVHQNERGEDHVESIEAIEVDEDKPDPSHSSSIRQSLVGAVRSNEQRIDATEEELEAVRNLAKENARLHDRVNELEETVEKMRADLAALWSIQGRVEDGRHAVRLDEESVWAPESVNPHDPTREFL
jgi:dynactin complex subunit